MKKKTSKFKALSFPVTLCVAFLSFVIVSIVTPTWAPLAQAEPVHKPHGDKLYIHHGVIKKPIGTLKNTAAYMMVGNPLNADDVLSSVSGDFAERLEIHKSEMKNGVMTMREVAPLKIPAKSYTKFAPGGLHIMLLGIKRDLKIGEKLQIELHFQNAGSVKADFIVSDKELRGSHGHNNDHHKDGDKRGPDSGKAKDKAHEHHHDHEKGEERGSH